VGAEEHQQVDEVFQSGGVLCRRGFDERRNGCFKVHEFEEAFAARIGVPHALAVTSGTAALRVALAALGVGPGDEVVTQSFTFVATVEAIIESGATPVCTEVDGSLNMDVADLSLRITQRTRAVIVVHMLGTPARLREVLTVCAQRGIPVIEDTAWGCGGSLDGRPLGTWGSIGTFSFDNAKTMTTGEGGMVVFAGEEEWRRAAAWHDHGHENNPDVPRWEDTRSGSGFNFRMMELQAAVGLAQLEKLAHVVTSQVVNRDCMWDAICDLPGITPRDVPDGSSETADALVFFVADRERARQCRESLLAVGVSTKILPEAVSWHFADHWAHMPELVEAHGGNLDGEFPKSKALIERAVSLPVTVNMADELPALVRSALVAALETPLLDTDGQA
jgi:8-amino-3,8-dideoxy-alpha-D-manno-octulosonate transaminase